MILPILLFLAQQSEEAPCEERVVPGQGGGHILPAPGMHPPPYCRLAVETDQNLLASFGGDLAAMETYVQEVVHEIGFVYEDEVECPLVLVYVGNHTWTSTDKNSLLDNFQAAWRPFLGHTWPVEADAAIIMTSLYGHGGVAYVDALCNDDFAFGCVTGVHTEFAITTLGGPSVALTRWDDLITAHELGHEFGLHHTNTYCPPLDHCLASCEPTCCGPSTCDRGTIMSGCTTCGGLDRVDLVFHPVQQAELIDLISTSCLARR